MKALRNIIMVALVLFCISVVTEANAEKIKYNNKQVDLTVPIKEVKGVSYIYFKDYSKLIDANYSYNKKLNEITIQKNEQFVTVKCRESLAITGSNQTAISVKVINGRSMIPIRQLNNLFGLFTANDFNTDTIMVADTAIQNIGKKPQQAKPQQWSIPTMKLNQARNIQIPILCYHVISEGAADTMYTPYWQFENHLKALQKQGYTAVTPKQVYEAYYLGRPLPKKPILITFDDGYYDNYSLAYPLLKKYNMKGTIFIIASQLQQSSNISPASSLKKISWDNVEEMKSHVTIQNHTYNSHEKTTNKQFRSVGMIATPIKINGKWEITPQYTKRIKDDFQKAEQLIKLHTGYGSYIFSYPYGQFSSTTKSVLKELNIPLAVTVKSGTASNKSNAYELPRIIVDGKWDGNRLIKQINTYAR